MTEGAAEETRGKVHGAPARLTVGARFAGRYDVTGVLGAGGMGVVYEATRVDDGMVVALKVLHRHLVANDQVTKRFHREAAFLRRLDGPHIVPIVDAGEDEDGRLFMALERVRGEPLDLWLQARGVPPVEEAVRIVCGVAEALVGAHEKGIIHRDLKPANIMLEAPDETTAGATPSRVRVLDFGLAKALGEASVGQTVLTERNMVFGTPEYMAPEQVRGDDVDARTDVYALGVVLFQLLVGRVPFALATGVATMSAQISEAPPSVRGRAPDRDISPAIAEVVRRALAKEPAARFSSVAAFREALSAALAHPETVPPVSEVEPPTPRLDLADPDIGVHDTLLEASSRRGVRVSSGDPLDVDPLAATAAFRAEDVPIKAPPRVSPEALAEGRTSWAWIVVFVVAAAVGIGLGLLVGR